MNYLGWFFAIALLVLGVIAYGKMIKPLIIDVRLFPHQLQGQR